VYYINILSHKTLAINSLLEINPSWSSFNNYPKNKIHAVYKLRNCLTNYARIICTNQ